MMDEILENNFILYSLITILLILLIIYTYMLIQIRKQKKLESENEEEVPMTKAEALALEEERRKNVVEIVENVEEIAKDATYIPDLKKNIEPVLNGSVGDTYQFRDIDSIKVISNKDDSVEISAENENIAFGKDVIFDKSINDNIKVEEKEAKFEKTEVIDLDEIYKLVDSLNKKE